MRGETTSRHRLRQHQIVIERCLADVKTGKNIGHLSHVDVAQMIAGLEKRLATLAMRLATHSDE